MSAARSGGRGLRGGTGSGRRRAAAAGPPGFVPLVFEHGQEPGHRRGVDVGEVEVGRPGAGLLADPREQEPECVAVGRDGARAAPRWATR